MGVERVPDPVSSLLLSHKKNRENSLTRKPAVGRFLGNPPPQLGQTVVLYFVQEASDSEPSPLETEPFSQSCS